MTVNVGNIDRVIRVILGLALIVAPLLNVFDIWSNGVWAYVTMAVGAVLVVTGLVRMCPIYRILGVNTRRI